MKDIRTVGLKKKWDYSTVCTNCGLSGKIAFKRCRFCNERYTTIPRTTYKQAWDGGNDGDGTLF